METPIRADVDKRYYLRFLLIGIVAVGFALYCIYDGTITYPNQRVRALEYQRLEKEGQKKEWPAFARGRGWPTDPPGEPKTDADFQMQFIMATITGAIGLWMLIGVLRSRGRWIEASESGLTSSWGQNFDFDSVVAVHKKKWRRKGIAKIAYEQNKRKRRFVLDNYKFLREPTNAILLVLESKIETDKIVGGPPEAPIEEIGEPVEGLGKNVEPGA